METIGRGDLRRAVGHVAFARGLDYFERGMVRSVEFDTPCRVNGRVSGSRSKPYSVWATLALEVDGRLLSVEGHCSCPVGFNCKHVAAVLLAAQESSEGRIDVDYGAASEALSGDVRQWLDRWPEAGAGRSEKRPASPPSRSQEHLFYVIHRDAMRRAHITPYRSYLRKDGTIGTNFREFQERNSSGTQKYVTVEDAAILGKLDYYADGGYPRGYSWPEGEELIGLIREIVDTGRARAEEIRGAALSWAEPRRCELAWSVGESGEQEIVTRDGAGSPVTLLPFPTPLFVDPESGEIGVAETALKPRMASWFAAAPAVRRGSVAAVAAKLSRIGQHAPVPRLHRVEERTDVRPVPVLTLYGCTHRLPRYVYGDHRGSAGDAASVVYPCARLEVAYDGASTAVRAGRGDDIAASGQDGFAVIRRDRAREAAFEKALREAAKRYGYEDHELLRYDHALPRELREADIVFPPVGDEDDAAGGAGIGFASQAVPQLRAEGWRVEIEGTWPFRLYEGPIVFSTSLENPGHPTGSRFASRSRRTAVRSTSRRSSSSSSMPCRWTNGEGWRKTSTSRVIWPAGYSTPGSRTERGLRSTRRGSRGSPRPFWRRRGCSVSTGPRRAGCSSWPRRWRVAARRGPGDGRFSISAPVSGLSPRPRKCRPPPRCAGSCAPTSAPATAG